VFLARQPERQWEGVLVEKRGASGTFIIPELALETSIHLPSELALNTRARLSLRSVDLPRLDARFRIDQIIEHD